MGAQYDWIRWIEDALVEAGISVVKYPGWRTRGLGDYRPWVPDSVVWHHDASGKGNSPWVPKFIVSDIENHGAHVWIDRYGVWHLLAAGRVGHTGAVKSGMPDNERAIGIETDHTTGEKWPPALLESLRMGTAAIFNARGWDASDLYFHKQISSSGKVDPDGLSLAKEKSRVTHAMEDLLEPPNEPYVSLSRVQRLAEQATWSRGYGASGRTQVALIEMALAVENKKNDEYDIINYRRWQQSLGFTGKDADGIPGEESLKKLGKRSGLFVVIP